MNIEIKKALLQKINFYHWQNYGLHIQILRDDLIHPFVSGNKWRKLKYNIEDFQKSNKKAILTFGGAFSNHLIATAAASKIFNFKATGIIRGENVSNDYISFLNKCGMDLHFINRTDYRKKSDPQFIEDLLRSIKTEFNPQDFFIIPEGGSNEAAVRGVSEIMNDIGDADYVVCACGTGATIAGIARALKEGQQAIGIPVLKAEGYIEQQVVNFNGSLKNTTIIDGYHFGGYARSNETLLNFCNDFTQLTNIPTEPVYTGKMFFAVDDLIRKQYFKEGSRIVLIHTGGIFNFATPF